MRCCIPVSDGVPIFEAPPLIKAGTAPMKYLEEQMLQIVLDDAALEEPGVVKHLNDVEAHFMALSDKYGLSHACSEEILVFCRKCVGPDSQTRLRTYRSMRADADARAADRSDFRVLRVDVDPKYTDTQRPYVDFECRDLLSVIVGILSDPNVVRSADDFTRASQTVVDEDGQRRYNTNVNTGNWQQRTEEKLFGPADDRHPLFTIGPVIIFSDGVALTKRGDQGAHPLMVSLACLKPEVRQRQGAWRIGGYLPKLEGQAAKATENFKTAQTHLYQTCIAFFFQPLCEAYDAGGFYLLVAGELHCIVPVVAYFTVDSMEANFMTGVRCSVNSNFPCRFCWCPKDQMNDPDCDVVELARTASSMRALCLHLEDMKGDVGQKTRVERLETQYSVHARYNPLWDLPYGDNPRGIFSACPPELLHQYLLGIMKYAYKFTWAHIDSLSPGGGKRMSARACRVDDRFKLFDVRHVDPELPRTRFRRGARKLAKLEGKDYRALLLQFIVALGVEGLIIPAVTARLIQAVLWKVCEVYDMVTTYDGHTTSNLAIITARIKIMMTDFKSLFSRFSKSDCRFSKFHYCLHLVQVILEWASMRAVDTTFGEAGQRVVRQNYSATSRRVADLHTELSRVSLRSSSIKATAAARGINLDARKLRRGVGDTIRGRGVHYDARTGVTDPYLVLPRLVRGRAFLTALDEYKASTGLAFDFAGITLHTSMRLSAGGSPDPTIFHAGPAVYGKPWYDHVRLLFHQEGGMLSQGGERSGVVGNFAFWVGKLQTFVCLPGPQECVHLLALVHLYGSVDRKGKKGKGKAARGFAKNYVYDMDAPSARADGVPGVPFQVMEPCYYSNGDPVLWLVDTEVISRGLWAQQCFDRPGKYWFLARGECVRHHVQ